MGKLHFDASTPLYTSDARAWRIEQLEAAMATLVGLGKPVVLFVHGRGKEPNKSLRGATFTEGKAVHKIERGYGVSVLMFNWDSAFPGLQFLDRERPLAHTAAGASAFCRALHALSQFEASRPDAAKPSLLVHSMGSVVVQKSLVDGKWPPVGPLFRSVLLSQPDADDIGHAEWLEMLALRERTYVTWNRDDHVLRRSTDARPPGAHALGLGTSEPLASHATYVDLSRMGAMGTKDEDHEVFGKGAMNGQLNVCAFFSQALTGSPVVLDLATNVESIERDVVYRLRARHEPDAPCLKVPQLPD